MHAAMRTLCHRSLSPFCHTARVVLADQGPGTAPPPAHADPDV
jgi:hypothetical protein